jgi:hypothetical protein
MDSIFQSFPGGFTSSFVMAHLPLEFDLRWRSSADWWDLKLEHCAKPSVSTLYWFNDKLNGHFRILNWRYLPYIRPI